MHQRAALTASERYELTIATSTLRLAPAFRSPKEHTIKMSKHTGKHRVTLSLLTLATLGASAPGFADDAHGFLEDAKVNLNLRNFYFNRNFVDNGKSIAVPGPTKRGEAAEWTQSFILDAKSGFTNGFVGFGVDVLGLMAVKLDGGKGTYGTALLPVHDGNVPADDFGRLAVAGKAKISKTELKIGEWMPVLPIVRADDGRALPQTLRGGQLTSKEIKDVTLYAGQFSGNSQPVAQYRRHHDSRQTEHQRRSLQLRRRRVHLQRQTYPGGGLVRSVGRHLPPEILPDPALAADHRHHYRRRQPRLLHR
jgi:hypothetical protein